MFGFDNPGELFIRVLAIVVALSFHEYSHARIAFAFGDQTARLSGRLTLNPLRHLDPIGTLMLIFFSFGWAKPVPVNPYNLRIKNKHVGMLWVSLAGPMMNFLMATISALLLSLLYGILAPYFPAWGDAPMNFIINFFYFLFIFAIINIVLAVFNLLPIPPLDGSKILAGLLPHSWANKFYEYERYGSIIMILLLVTHTLSALISPVIGLFQDIMFKLPGLNELAYLFYMLGYL